MGLPNTALAGMDDAPQPVVPGPANSTQINAPTDTLSGGPENAQEIPSFSKDVATNANTMAASNPAPQRPGSWARALMGGVVDALAGAGAGGKVPEGAGGLYGAGAAARQIQARRDQQKQQGIENQQKQAQMSSQEAISRATIAHENAATMQDELLNANLSSGAQAKGIETGKAALQPYITGGAPILQEGITSDEAQALIQQKKLSPSQQHAFPSGQVPVLGKDGQPMTDKAGNPVMRNTYTVVGDVPQVTLDAATSKLISENTPYKLPEGTTMSGIVYGTLVQRAKSAKTAQLAVDEQLEKAGIEKSNLDLTAAAQKMRPDWGAALAKSNLDVGKALHYMLTDPQMRQKYPDAVGLVSSLYGNQKNLDEVLHNQNEEKLKAAEDAQKAKEDKEKADAKGDYTGDPNATTPQAFLASLSPNEQGIVKEIGEGRAPLNNPGYLLARKSQIMEAVARAYPDFDGSKIKSYQDTYHDFTAGKTSIALNSGGTALQHLDELRALNTKWSRIPGTKDYQAYQNKVNTVAPELARFYGNDTEQGIKNLKDTLDATFNRDAAIVTQAKSMGDKIDSYEQQWLNAAPSKAYQAPMPGISDAAKQARAKLDPQYAAKVTTPAGIARPTATGPGGQKLEWNGTAWVPPAKQ